jgi:hypothetical protein
MTLLLVVGEDAPAAPPLRVDQLEEDDHNPPEAPTQYLACENAANEKKNIQNTSKNLFMQKMIVCGTDEKVL